MNDRDGQPLQAGGLPVLNTGLNLSELDMHGGQGFWDEVRRFARHSQLDHQLAAAMGGRAAPRIWVFLESPGAGPAAAAAALAAAWVLADRGQMVILVDADEKEPRITRWLGRTEQEGWIDMVRFGASLKAASVPLPSEGRRGSALGVGTFAPTGITPDEVADLLIRLRRQTDDLILVLPAKLRSLPWIETANIRLLCWDLLSRSTANTEKILAELDRMGARPDALLGFGVEEYTLIQSSLREEPAEARALIVEAQEHATCFEETVEERESSPSITIDLMTAACETSPSDEAVAAAVADDGGDLPRRRTSRIFIIMAAVVVVSLALLGVFLRTQLRPAQVSGDLAAVKETSVVVAEHARPDATDGIDLLGGDPALPASEADELSSDGDLEPGLPGHRVDGDPSVEELTAHESRADILDTEAMDWSPYRQAAGQDGWTLWLYSVPNEQSAASEVRRLERLGIRAASRIVTLPEKGRWWRICAGSFSSRDAAQTAAAALLIELKHDWAVPERF